MDLPMKWPSPDVVAMGERDGVYYKGAAVCRRGHTATQHIDPTRNNTDIPENCPTCGARVLIACPGCELRIRGKRHVPRVVSMTPAARPSFCDGCGQAFPWATREERIYELENLLDESDVDPADLVVVQDALQRLRSEGLSAKDEQRVWQTVRDRGGAALKAGPVQRVLEGLVSAAIRAQLGL